MKSLCRLAANRFSGMLTPSSRQTICLFRLVPFTISFNSHPFLSFPIFSHFTVLNSFTSLILTLCFPNSSNSQFFTSTIQWCPFQGPHQPHIDVKAAISFFYINHPGFSGVLSKAHINHPHISKQCHLSLAIQYSVVSFSRSTLLTSGLDFFRALSFHSF